MEYKEKNPWKGLDTYLEGDILYGRDEDIRKLSQCVLGYDDTVLYGRSGIGKSSLLNAGILPASRIAEFTPIYIRLNHRKEETYYNQILHSIKNEGIRVVPVSPVKDEKKPMLWELFHCNQFKTPDGNNDAKIIIIFDQFEEIFTLQQNNEERRNFFYQIGSVLNKVIPDELEENIVEVDDTPVKPVNVLKSGLFINIRKSTISAGRHKIVNDNILHFVFSLREDFLSDFEYYTSAIPSLRQHRYGLRPINEEQASEIILRPRKGLVAKDVAKLIIEEVTQRTDFELDGVPEIEVDSAVLSLYMNRLFESHQGDSITAELVEEKGGAIIKDFYENSISDIDGKSIEYLENTLVNDDNHRENKSFNTVSKVIGSNCVDLLIERSVLRKFVLCGDYKVEFIHDILCPVVKERMAQRDIQRQQQEERKRQEEEKKRIQEEAELKRRETEEKAAREMAELEAESVRVKRRNRNRLIALSSFIAFIVFAIGSYYYLFENPYSEIYGNFTTKNGWPIGLGGQFNPSSDKEKCFIYYKLTRNGRLSSFMGKSRSFTKVEILNCKGKPSTNIFIESPVVRFIDRELDDAKAAEFAKLLSSVSYWQYTPDANGLISMKTAFDINNQELYSENYSSTNNIKLSSKHVLWCVFYDKKGNPLQVSDNGTDRIRYTISDGYITGSSFFTVLGTPQLNTSGVYGYSYEVDSLSANVVSQCEVDKFGDKVDSTIVHFTAFENGHYRKSDVCNVEYSEQNVIWKYRDHNDTIHVSQSGIIDYVTAMYDDAKRLLIRYKSQDELLEKKIISNDTLVCSENYFYSSKLDSIQYFNLSTQPSLYTEKYSYLKKNVTEITFWSNGEKILRDIDLEGIICHKVVKETSIQNSDSTITTSYLDSNNALTQKGRYSKTEKIFEKNSGNILFEYYYDFHDEICKSEMFTYNEYGIKVSRAVAGIDRTPVRCPNWDSDGWSYYRMKFIKSDQTDKLFIVTAAVDEFDNWIPVVKAYGNELYEICYRELPLRKVNEVSGDSIIFGESLSNLIVQPLSNFLLVPYIHILTRKGSFYNAKETDSKSVGLRDGDIICNVNNTNVLNGFKPQRDKIEMLLNEVSNNGGKISIMRIDNGVYKKKQFIVTNGDKGAEFHIAPVNSNINLK